MFQVNSFLLVGVQFCQHVLFHRLLPPLSSFYTLVKHHLNISTRGVFVFVLTILFRYAAAAAAAKSCQSCPTLCDPSDGSPPGSSVPGILEARTLEWVSISFSNACMHAKSLQMCPTLSDPIDGSPPGSSVPGFLQARILEWVAISFYTF